MDQTTFGAPEAPPAERGDCFSAAIASILSIDVKAVPRFCELGDCDWTPEVNRWLRPRGLAYIELEVSPEFDYSGLGYHVLSGPSPRNGGLHAVVGHGGVMVHDPHPSRAGLEPGERYIGVFIQRFGMRS